MARSRRTASRKEVAAARQPDPNDDPDDSFEAPSAPENDNDDAASNPPTSRKGTLLPTASTTLMQSFART